MNIVRLGPEYFPQSLTNKPISGAQIYVGIPDTDPEIIENQTALYVQEEDGTIVEVAQPIRTSTGGIPLYSGSPVTLLVNNNYSLKVLSSLGIQLYYIPNVNISLNAEGFSTPDYSAVDQGVTGDLNTVKFFVDAMGTNNGTILLKHNSGEATTTYTFLTNETIPANINVIIENGAVISVNGGVTLTLNSFFEAGLQKLFIGDGDISFTYKNKVYPEWWYSGAGSYTSAIQAAIDSLLSGGVVQFSSATYSLVTTVNFADDVDIIGAGWASKITRLAAETIYAFTGTDVNNITVKDLWFDTIGSINMVNCDDIRVEGCKFTDVNHGYMGIGYYSGHRIWILDNYVYNTTLGGGITVQGDATSDLQDVIVKGNIIESVYEDGIMVRAYNGNATRIVIEGNNLYDIGKHGIQCSIGSLAADERTYENVSIVGNNIVGWGKNVASQAILIQAINAPTTYRIKNVTIANNTIKSLDPSARLENEYIQISYAEGGTCTGNTGRGGTDNSGISLSISKNIAVANNTIELAAQNHAGGGINEKAGIVFFQTFFSTISGNIIKNTGTTTVNRPGIFIWNSKDNIIQGNICHDDQVIPTQSWGIQEYESGAGGQLDRNNYIANKEYLNVEGDEDFGKTLTYQGQALNPFSSVLTYNGAGCAAGATAGKAKTIRAVDFRYRSKVGSRAIINDFWDLTGVTTGANEYKKVLLCIDMANAAMIVESKIASTQARANIPKRPDIAMVALGFVEIDQNYAGGALGGNFYDLWQW